MILSVELPTLECLALYKHAGNCSSLEGLTGSAVNMPFQLMGWWLSFQSSGLGGRAVWRRLCCCCRWGCVALHAQAYLQMKNGGGPVGIWLLSGNWGACAQFLCLPFRISRPALLFSSIFYSMCCLLSQTESRSEDLLVLEVFSNWDNSMIPF